MDKMARCTGSLVTTTEYYRWRDVSTTRPKSCILNGYLAYGFVYTLFNRAWRESTFYSLHSCL